MEVPPPPPPTPPLTPPPPPPPTPTPLPQSNLPPPVLPLSQQEHSREASPERGHLASGCKTPPPPHPLLATLRGRLRRLMMTTETESVEDGGGGSGSGGGDGGGGGSGGGSGSGAADRSTGSHGSSSSGGGGGISSVAKETPAKVARIDSACTSSSSTIVQEDGMAETTTHTSTTTSRFSTATTKVKTIKIVKKTSPLIASAISDLHNRAEASLVGAPPRRPLAGGTKKVVRPIKIQQETSTTTKATSKDVPKAVGGKINDVKLKETKVEVVKECGSHPKEMSEAGASTSPAVNSENTSVVSDRSITVGNAQMSQNEASCGTGKVIPITRKGSPGPKQPSKVATTSSKTSKSLTSTKETLRSKRQPSPLSKTEASTPASHDASQTEQARLSESEKIVVEPSLNITASEDLENSKIATASSSASVSSSSSVSSSASIPSASSTKSVKAVKVKKPPKAKKQESTEITSNDNTSKDEASPSAAFSESIDQNKEKVANGLDGTAGEVKDDNTEDKTENNKIIRMENGLEVKNEPNNENYTAEVKDSTTKDESKETRKDVKSKKKENKASCKNIEENEITVKNDTSSSEIKDDKTEREKTEKIVSKVEVGEVTTTSKKDEGESLTEENRLTNGETGEDEKKQEQPQEQDVSPQVTEVPAIPPPPPPPPNTKKIKLIGKAKSRKAVATQDTATEDGRTSPRGATSVPEISVSGAAASTDVPKIDINGEGDGEEDTRVTGEESATVSKWEPKTDRDAEEPELASVCVVVRDMSGFNTDVNKVTLAMCADSTCGQLMTEVGRRFKYDPDSFSLVLQCSDGDQVEIEKMEAERTLAHAWFQVEGTSRNNLILCDLGGRPPRRADDDDLTLGASASPTTTIAIPATAATTEKSGFERSFIAYDASATTSDYSSYSSPLIKHNSGFVGLVNQAMTCYLNSLLQTLFMTPEFRNALYQWEFKGSEEEASKNIPCQLQRLFLQLQTTNKSAVETTKLTRSFGWDSSEAWQQHDIQELCRVMFDALEQCFKNTHQSDLINTLYEGKMKDYVKCLECGNERAREDTYLDIPLPIRPFGSTSAYKSVEEALRSFVSPEVLTGNNQYKCARCDALCDAHKGLKFTRFPYLLTIHLMRFDFDYQTLHRIKLNDKVTFPDMLDLNHFIDGDAAMGGEEGGDKPAGSVDDSSTTDSGSALDAEDTSLENTSVSLPESDNQEEDEGIDVSSSSAYNNERNRAWVAGGGGGPYVYELFSIMIHSGSASGGHYYAYIKDLTSREWFCFNDQSVTKITYDDIRKTYGGSGSSRSGGYYSSWSSSANAYMLMYRRVDRERNVYSLTTEDFPQHITDLIKRMSDEEAAEREQRELERSTCRIKLFCRLPGQSHMVERKFRVHKYATLAESTVQAHKELGLENVVPLERCRLVKYEEFHESLECSFEGQEEEPMYEVLGGVRTSYKFDLLMEIRDEDKQFEVYKPGGTTIKAHVVNLSTEEVEGPFTLRGSLSMTVQDLKELLGRSLNLNQEAMRVVLERYYNDLRPLTSDTKTLKIEGFYRSNKVYVEASGVEAVDFFSGSHMYSILDRYENTITLYCPLPDTSPEALEELQIPPFKEEEVVEATTESQGTCTTTATNELITSSTTTTTTTATTTTAVDTETTDTTVSSAPPSASSPAESAASPASCSSKDSGISSKGGITDTGSSSSDGSGGTISRGSSLVSPTSSSSPSSSPTTSTSSPSSSSSSSPSSVTQQTSSQQQPLPSPSSVAATTITTITSATPSSTPTASPTTASTTLVLGNCSDGEDEGIADADSGTGSSHVNSDQSASEDSSLTSDSDRTLVGEPPEDRLSDTSNSPDYHNVSPPTDPAGATTAAVSTTSAEAKDTDGAWGDDEKTTPQPKRYFRAEYFTEEDTGARMVRVWVDKRITIGQLKLEMQRWVGVSQDHFKLFKIYSNSQEFECTRMTETLTSYADNTRLSVRLGRALLPGEHRGKVYLLEPHNFEDPSKFLIDWVVRKGDTVANAKRAIVREVNARCPGMNLVPERVRLRKKSWKTPQAIYLDQHKFDDDITLFSNWELFLQVLDGPEQRTANVDELAIFVKRWRPSSHTTDPLTEIIIPEPTTTALCAKLSEVSEIPAENVEFAKGKGTFPCDMSVLDIASELDWSPRSGQLDQRPLYIMDDGAMIYYRDKTEPVKELTEEQRRDLAVSENQRLNREFQCCPSSSFTPSSYSSTVRSREKGLKIYLNHDD